MGVNFMPKTVNNSYLKSIIKSGLLGSAFIIIMLIISAFILMKLEIGQEFYFVILVLISILSGAVAGFNSARKKRENGLINGLISTFLPSCMLLTGMTAAYKGLSVLELLPIAACMLGGIIGGIAAVNIKSKKKKQPNRRK